MIFSNVLNYILTYNNPMNRIQRTVVSALLITDDDKLFLGKKAPGGGYDNCWHIPGGGVEENEFFEAALKREVLEETGIDISQSKIKLIDNQGRGITKKTNSKGKLVEVEMEFNVFQVSLEQKSFQVEVKLNSDLVEYVWADLQQLNDFKHTPPSVELFKRIGWK